MNEKLLKITKIELQKKNKDRMSIYINEEFGFGLHKEIVFKFGIEKGKELDKDFIEKIIKAEEQNKANNYAINLLSYRHRTKKEIIDRMKRKGYEETVVSNTIRYLDKFGYINDKEFAKEFVKIKSRKLGIKRIKAELGQKGIGEEIIYNVIQEEFDESEEYNRALEIGKKRVKSYRGEEKQKIYRKLGAYLQRKGFDYGIVSKVLKEILNE